MNPIPVHAFNPGPMVGAGNTTWLIPGRVPTLIDAGTGEVRHLEALQTALAGALLVQVLVTHTHIDHASGAVALARDMPHLRFFKMPSERDGRWGVAWEPLADGDRVAAGDGVLEVVHTPGHSPDHLCFWDERERQLYCGDLAWKGSTVVIPPRGGGDLAAYLASLERVIGLAPLRMFPAHGPVIDEPEALLLEYIRHRRMREQQVLAAVSAGLERLSDIASRIYPTLEASLRPMAEQSVLAHLIKLEHEGNVGRSGDQWTSKPSRTHEGHKGGNHKGHKDGNHKGHKDHKG